MKELSDEAVQFVVSRLKTLADVREVDQKEIAAISEVAQPTVSRIFSGALRPSTEVLSKLSSAFGLTLSGILEEADQNCKEIVGYLATPLTSVVQNPKAEKELRRVVASIKEICRSPEFTDSTFEIYWPGDHTHPRKNANLKPNLVYLKDRSTASTYNFLVIFCAEPSFGVGQENEIATQAGTPAIRLIPPTLSRMMLGSFISSKDVVFHGDLTSKISFDEGQFKEALSWVRRCFFSQQALFSQLNGKRFGDRLRHLVEARVSDRKMFAEELGIAPHYLSALMDEPIAVSNPSVQLMKKIALRLRISVGHLVGEANEADPIWVESNASWHAWVKDGTKREAGLALSIRDDWRAQYKESRIEETVRSFRKNRAAMTVRDWEKLYREREPRERKNATGSLF